MSTRFGNGMVPAASRFNPRMTRFAAQAPRTVIDRPAQKPEEMAAWISSFLSQGRIHVENGDAFFRNRSAGETELVNPAFKLESASDAFTVRFQETPRVLEVENANGPVEEQPERGFLYQRPNHFLYPLSEAKVEITPRQPDSAQPFKKMIYEKAGRHHKLSVDYTDATGTPHHRVLEHTAEIRRDVEPQAKKEAVNPFKLEGQAIEQVRDKQDPTGLLHQLNHRLALQAFLDSKVAVPEEIITLPSMDSSSH